MGIYATALTSGSGTTSQVKLGGIIVLVGLAAQVGAGGANWSLVLVEEGRRSWWG